MNKTISLLLLLILSLCNLITLSYGAGGNSLGVYPNFVDDSVLIDLKLLKPLDPKYNADLTKNRINLIFTYDKEVNTLRQKTIQMLDNSISDYYFFKTEPYISNKDAFNFWYMDMEVDDKMAYEVKKSLIIQGVKFASLVMNLNGALEDAPKDSLEIKRSNADLPFIIYNTDKTEIDFYDPGNARFYYNLPFNDYNLVFFNDSVFKHELNHSILNLRDEYQEPKTTIPTFGYPNCAETEEQAKSWWGNLIGKVDPEFYTFRDEKISYLIKNASYEFIDNKLYKPEYTYDAISQIEVKTMVLITKNEVMDEEDYRVTLTNNIGCFADSGLSYRPTKVSHMNNSYSDPLLGYVNNVAGAKILNLFNKSTTPATSTIQDDRYDFNYRAVSNANCKVILKNEKHVLDCYYKYQKTNTSTKIRIGYGIIESTPDSYTDLPYDDIKNPCIVLNNFTEIYCTGIELENYNPAKTYSIGLIVDSSSILVNPTEKELAYSKNTYLTALNNHPREEYIFQLSELISAEELKPKTVTNSQLPNNNTKPNYSPTAKLTTSIALPRTGGIQNQSYIIAFLILTALSFSYKKQSLR
jgi:hypothetical protein